MPVVVGAVVVTTVVVTVVGAVVGAVVVTVVVTVVDTVVTVVVTVVTVVEAVVLVVVSGKVLPPQPTSNTIASNTGAIFFTNIPHPFRHFLPALYTIRHKK